MSTLIGGSGVVLSGVVGAQQNRQSKWEVGPGWKPQRSYSGIYTSRFDLGTITVPLDYKGGNERFHKLRTTHSARFSHLSVGIPYEESYALRAGDSFHVEAYQQVSVKTDLQDRVAFLDLHEACLIGVQGLILLWEQLRVMLPEGLLLYSFGEHERHYRNTDDHRVPVLGTVANFFQIQYKAFQPGELSCLFLVFKIQLPLK